MANPSYGGIGAAAAARGLAYAVEIQAQTDWNVGYSQQYPTLSRLMKLANGGSENGPKILFPVWLTNGATTIGVARSEEGDAITPASGDGTQGEVAIAKYATSLSYKYTELTHYAKASTAKRGSIMQGRAKELKDANMRKLAADIFLSTDGSDKKLISLPFVMATANTVHGISQSSYANWQSNVTAVGGTLSETMIDEKIDYLIGEKDANPGLIVAGKSGSVDVYAKLKYSLKASEQLTRNVNDSGGKLKTGYTGYEFRGIEVVRDHHMPSGELYILDLDTWGWHGDSGPKSLDGVHRLDQKLAYEHIFVLEAALYCMNPGRNARLTGITG